MKDLKKKHIIKSFFYSILIFLSFLIQAQDKKFRLEGFIPTSDSSRYATLLAYGGKGVLLDTVEIVNHHFVFEGEISHSCLAQISTEKIRGGLGVWLTNSHIKVKFSLVKYGEHLALLQTSKVEGAQESMDYFAFINQYTEITKNLDSRAQTAQCELIESYIKKYAHSYLSLALLKFSGCNIYKKKAFFEGLADEIKNSTEGISEKMQIERSEAFPVGGIFPDVDIPDINGEKLLLSQAIKGNTIIFFWAAWCGACRVENRELTKHKALISQKSIKVIGVSFDDNVKEWTNAIKKDEIDWCLNLSDLLGTEKNSMYHKLKMASLPYMLLVDKDRKIQAIGYSNILKVIKSF
ncbi:MAG: redoxin domain-containing protein [Thermoflexibacter sp.]|jgi:peroxiredoxin|nr:redoxin domain-containing protein [Thermoflexibacter sp.]